MIEYIMAIKRMFRDKYNFKPIDGNEGDPIFGKIPDGEYPMVINDRTDYVRIKDGKIHCCNWENNEEH